MLKLLLWFAKYDGKFFWNEDIECIYINTTLSPSIGLYTYNEQSLNFDKLFFKAIDSLYNQFDSNHFNYKERILETDKEQKKEFYKLIKWFAQNSGTFSLIENNNYNIIVVKCKEYECSFRAPETNSFDFEWVYLHPMLNSLYGSVTNDFNQKKELVYV